MRNVLIVTIDCLRADSLGCMGYKRPLSPHIDDLAAESAVFTQAFATGPRTAESFPGILASTYPLTFQAAFALPDHVHRLAEVLHDAGYATAAFHSNPFLFSTFGYAKGFEVFWDSRAQASVTSRVGATIAPRLKRGLRLYRFLRRLVRHFEAQAGVSHFVSASEVNDRAIEWLRGNTRPYLLWIHYMDLHYPYSAPERCIRQIRPAGIGRRNRAKLLVRAIEEPLSFMEEEVQILRDLYDASLSYVDENVGALLEALQQMGTLQDTIVFLTGDHGEEFLEHGAFGHGSMIQSRHARRTRVRLYDELIHVPLIVRAPGLGVSLRQIPSLVSLIDIPPTVVDLLGVETVDTWQGVSSVPLLRGEADAVRDRVFSEYKVYGGGVRWPVVSCRTTRWKYIHDGVFGRHELYDLGSDTTEKHNLYWTQDSILSTLQQWVQEHLARVQSSRAPVVEAEMDPELSERLRGLGYIE